MRLIDADKLKRKEQKIATEAWKMKVTASVECILNQFIDHIDHAPTVDAVPVVCCKDCKHYEPFAHKGIPTGKGVCDVLPMEKTVIDDWFCADGEEREDALD